MQTSSTRKPYSVRPHHQRGEWFTDVDRFYENAEQLLRELEALVEELNSRWPVPLDQAITQETAPADLWAMARRRDLLLDSTRIFSAMAVEGFLNFYGAVRLGEVEFNAHFERLGLVPKLRQLLLICDGLSLSIKDPLVAALEAVAESRNRLVHPKAKEAKGDRVEQLKSGDPMPGAAQDAVGQMKGFFREFVVAVPAARLLLPHAAGADS